MKAVYVLALCTSDLLITFPAHFIKSAIVLFTVMLPMACGIAWAERANTYPGVILSINASPVKQTALHNATTTFAFTGLTSEPLNPGAALLRDPKVLAFESGPISGRKNLCRTAKIRRIIKRAQGRVRCSQNFELLADQEPNDPAYGPYLWGLKMINGPVAWDTTIGSRDVVVAVIDTGITNSHPDLKNNLWINEREILGNNVDDDANGYVDDYYGANTITRTGPGSDDNGHGTHVAGTIGAEGNNSEGVAGVNWMVRLMAVKFLDSSGSGSTANAIRSVEYVIQAKQRGANVVAINASWGGGMFNDTLFNAIKRAASLGIMFAASAGNSARNNDSYPSYPASYGADNIISVASIDSLGNLSYFSNYGRNSVHIAAPGSSIYSTIYPSGYAVLSGTSMASPHVAGVVALAYAACPSLAMSTLKQIVFNNGAKSAALTDTVVTGSVVNATGAVLAAKALCAQPTQTATPTATFTAEPTSTGSPVTAPTAAPIAPTATATPIPATSTATPVLPSPTSTPLPTGGYIFASPSTIPAATSISLNISSGGKTTSVIALKYVLQPLSGAPIQCPGATIVQLPQGLRSIRLGLPREAKHFTRIDVSFQASQARLSTQIFQTGAAPTTAPSTMASRFCRALTGQRFL